MMLRKDIAVAVGGIFGFSAASTSVITCSPLSGFIGSGISGFACVEPRCRAFPHYLGVYRPWPE